MPELRIRKGHPGHILRVNLHRHFQQHIGRSYLGHMLAHVRKLVASCDVADRINVATVGAAAIVHGNAAFGVGNAGGIQVEVGKVGAAAGGE